MVETNIPTEAKLYSDRFSLETILSNLLDNALFYRQSDSRVQIYVSLSNQGMDIEVINQMDVLLGREQLDKLTAPLYQVDSSRTDTTRYGLGLSIVNNLCEYNGYKLTIQQLEDRKQFVAKIHISNFNVSPKILSDSCDATHS
ncbi:ATP-binding protein [Vibrio olivae]